MISGLKEFRFRVECSRFAERFVFLGVKINQFLNQSIKFFD